MAGSRAASARESGQVREEAALSDTARAPRNSLAGANDQRARSEADFKEGCTVHLHLMAEADNVDLARSLVELWNAGDIDGVVDLYTEDAAMIAGPEWPDQAEYHGHDGVRANIEQWRSVWESSRIEAERIEAHGDHVVASGAWVTRGRASGIEGHMPFVILLTLRGGKIAVLEWFTDHDEAVAAARAT
jgi:ketosteroid isomerase-like protein